MERGGTLGSPIPFESSIRYQLAEALRLDLFADDRKFMDADPAWFEGGLEISDGATTRTLVFMPGLLYESSSKIAWRADRSGSVLRDFFQRWRLAEAERGQTETGN
jgi:hypothetical protein